MNGRNISPDRIKAARGVTPQAEIAFRMRGTGLRTTERHVRRWETGETTPHPNVLVPLAQALGVSLDSLFEPAAADEADEESDVLLRSAYELDRVGQYEMADDLRAVARRLVARESRGHARDMVRASDARHATPYDDLLAGVRNTLATEVA